MNFYIFDVGPDLNQFYILLKDHKLPFEKLYNSETSYTPLGGLGIRKDNFLKGVIEGKCTQANSDGPTHITWARLCRAASGERGIPTSRGGVTQETERKVEALKRSQAILPRSGDQANWILDRNTWRQHPAARGQGVGSGRRASWRQASHRDKNSRDLTGWVAGAVQVSLVVHIHPGEGCQRTITGKEIWGFSFFMGPIWTNCIKKEKRKEKKTVTSCKNNTDHAT